MKYNKSINNQLFILYRFFAVFLSLVLIHQLCITNSFASILEPNSQIYGQVFNIYKGDREIMTQGSIECTLKERGSEGNKYTFTSSITCMNCTEYVNGACKTCIDYYYKLEIPQKSADSLLQTDHSISAVTLKDREHQYDYVEIIVDGKPARMKPLWDYGNKATQEPGKEFILASQARRSHYYRVDLEIVNDHIDSDNDGMPDYWEDLHNLDKFDPKDASIDGDNDRLSNLQEYEKKGDPNVSNLKPSLDEQRIPIRVSQSGRSVINFHVLDADTDPSDISVALKTIPSGGLLVLSGGSETVNSQSIYEDKVMKIGDTLTVEKIQNGWLHFIHLDNSVSDCSFEIALWDDSHISTIHSLELKVWAPTKTDGTDAKYWADISRDASMMTQGQILDVLKDHSGTKLLKESKHSLSDADQQWMELHSVETTNTALVEKNAAITGKPALSMKGDTHFSLPRHIPLFTNGEITLFTVFKSTGSESQNLISSPYFQLGVTGKDHHSHPGELEFATSSGAVYGNLPVKDKWIMAGISRSEENTLFEIDGLWSGGPYIHEETTTMATGPQVGAKGILTWNHRLQDYDAQYTEKFEGYLGEILLFDGKMSDNRKWRTVAYLLSKWIGYVVYDGSDESHSVYAEGASGETLFTKYESEFVPAYGKDFKYVIIGGAWDDELTGGHEDDILIGNTGDDVLCGKGGKDIFVVDNGDLIVDFYEPDGDKINLVHLFKNAKGDIHHYLNIETDGTETYLLIDEDGDGSGFTDAKITIRHNVYRDLDMPRLWADGFLVTGGIRPHLTVAINQLSDTSIEVTREAATFEICFNESHVPKNLTVVLNETGTATVGEDFILETSIYNEDTETYERVEATDGIVPIQPGPDSLSQKVWVVPIADGKREADETISLIIGAKGEYYDVAHENQANIILKDGKDIVGIQSTRPMAYETGEISGSLSVYRKGSITESLVVQLGIQGTATNGRDYLYLPTEVSIPAGKNAVTIDISPIKDFDTELDEVVEIIVQPKESYVLDDSRSAIVNITDSSIKSGDINGDERITIKDLIIVLQVTTGKAQKTDFFIESEISGDGQIDIQDAVYTLRIISEMK